MVVVDYGLAGVAEPFARLVIMLTSIRMAISQKINQAGELCSDYPMKTVPRNVSLLGSNLSMQEINEN